MVEFRRWIVALSCLPLLVLVAYAGIPKHALHLGAETLANRQLQTRRFDGITESDILAAGAGVLQDLGFTITESETALGVVVGNKDRSAVNAGQVAAAVVVALLGGGAMPTDRNQRIVASLVTRPVLASDGQVVPDSHYVRVTFARVVWNTRNEVTAAEQLTSPELDEGFFDKLSKSVFLEAHRL